MSNQKPERKTGNDAERPERKKGEHALTWRQVRRIRERYKPGGLGRSNTMERIAKDYGVSVATIWAVVNRLRGYEDHKFGPGSPGRPPASRAGKPKKEKGTRRPLEV